MRRRIIGPACLLAAALALSTTGCETLRPSARKQADAPKDDAVEAVGGSADKIPAIDADGRNPAPFFKNNRLSGGLSDEARDIERSLGVK